MQAKSNNGLERYNKLFIAMRYFLIGMGTQDKRYLNALNALEYAKAIHIGYRKDGVTPEFQHQLEIAHYLRTLLPLMEYPAEVLCASFLHDVPEDYDIAFEEIESKFGKRVRESVYLLTKKYRGEKKSTQEYFGQLAKCPIASVVKGADRINNQQSMIGVFTLEKQKCYVEESEQYIIPMLKKARHLHVGQEAAYENIKLILNSQIRLISNTLSDLQNKSTAA